MSSSELTAPATPSGVVPSGVVAPPTQVRPRHDDLVRDVPAELCAALVDVGPAPALLASRAGTAVTGTEPDVDADTGRGTPLEALAGWGAALVVGAACWAGALAVVTRVV